MANYQRSTSFELCRQLLKMAPVLPPAESTSATLVWLCPNCQTPLTVVERLTAVQIAWRFNAFRVARELIRQDLDRDITFQLCVTSTVHFPHTAFSDERRNGHRA
jgi:hypothetical protein